MKNILFLLLLFFSADLYAVKIQFLHTNDVHSYFDHAEHNPNRGGYASIKTLMDQLESDSDLRTLRVDAGDFLEGNIFFMAKFGQRSFEIQEKMGFDFITLGNHDYLMGTKDLDKMLSKANPKFNFLASNVHVKKHFKAVNKHLKKYVIKEYEGIKIAFIGLTTDEYVFKWRLNNGTISKPINSARRMVRKLKRQGVDYIVAINHLGLVSDELLARKVPEINVIIGGHSHSVVRKVKMVQGTPIVQAGKHGKWLGQLVVDFPGDKKPIVVEKYKLHSVINIPRDPEIQKIVDDSKKDLDKTYGKDWLNAHIGKSFLNADGESLKKSRLLWNFFITDTQKDSLDADLSIHTPGLSGNHFPIGDITRKKLFNSYPRIFDFKDKHGWHIYRANVAGILIKTVLQAVMNFNLPLYFKGVTYKYDWNYFGGYYVWDIQIKGKPVELFKTYKVAFPEGIVRGGQELSNFAGFIFRDSKKTTKLMWTELEKRIVEHSPLTSNYLQGLAQDGFYFEPKVITAPLRE